MGAEFGASEGQLWCAVSSTSVKTTKQRFSWFQERTYFLFFLPPSIFCNHLWKWKCLKTWSCQLEDTPDLISEERSSPWSDPSLPQDTVLLKSLSSRRTCWTSCGPGFPKTHLAMELLLVHPPNPKCEMPGNIVQSTLWERLILVIIWSLQTSEALSMAELYSEDAVTRGLHVCLLS